MTTSLHGLSTGTVALLPVLVYFSVGVLTIKDFRSLSWDVLILMGGGLCLGTAITESGLAGHLVSLLPVEGFSVFWLMVMFGTVACIMSSLMSNTATANLVMPIVLSIGAESVSPLMIGIAFACTLAMPLPVSTPPNAMAFGTEQVSVSAMIRSGTVITVVGIVLAFTTGYWWWTTVGL
jgi:sodium-dependent dicarboxylate transporter 2/3/5